MRLGGKTTRANMAKLDSTGKTYTIHKGGNGKIFELHCNFEIIKTAKTRQTLNKFIEREAKKLGSDA